MGELWTKLGKTLCYYGERALQSARERIWTVRRLIAPDPIFVVGCSRAGTTLVYRTFTEVDELGSLRRETHDFWAALHPLAQRDWRSHSLPAKEATDADREFVSRYFYVHCGSARFVDKNNQNGLSIPYLHALYPRACFAYVKRNPGDNIHSLIEGWGMPERFGTWSMDLPAQVAIDGGKYTRWCFFLADGWRNYLTASIEDVCAFQYRAMNEAILAARRLLPDSRWVEIKYEDLLDDPVAAFRDAIQSAGPNTITELAWISALTRPCLPTVRCFW